MPGRNTRRQEEEFSEDEIDAFNSAKDKVAFEDVSSDDLDDDEDDEAVMGLDVEDDEDEEEEAPEEEEVQDKRVGGWGKGKAGYYEQHRAGAYEKQSEETAKLEEDEAKRLQRIKASRLTAEDFGDEQEEEEEQISKKKQKGKKKSVADEGVSADSALLRLINRDLEGGMSTASAETHTRKVDTSKLDDGEKLRVIVADSPELIGLLEEFKQKTAHMKEQLLPFMQRLKAGKVPASKGASLLELKYSLLLQYCGNISFYLSLKAKGTSVKDHPVITELLKIRSLLEKLKPLERKLKTQIDKILSGQEVSEEAEAASKREKRKQARQAKKASKNASEEVVEESEDEEDLFDEEEFPVDDDEDEEFDEEEEDEEELSGARKRKLASLMGEDLEESSDDEDEQQLGDGEVGVMPPAAKRMALGQALNAAAGIGAVTKRAARSGDSDLPYKEKKQPEPKKQPTVEDIAGKVEDVEEDEEAAEAAAVADKKSEKKAQRQQKREEKTKAKIAQVREAIAAKESVRDEDGKRKVNKKIEINRGMVRERSVKHGKTPMARMRFKTQKQERSMAGLRPKMKDKSKPFTGEAGSGIKARLIRSTQI